MTKEIIVINGGRIKMDLKDYLQESELEKIADELNKVERERIFGKEDYQDEEERILQY